MDPTVPVVVPTPTDTFSYRDAYLRVSPELDALPESELLPVNIEIPAAVTVLLGHYARMRALRDVIVVAAPTFNIARFDKLPDYAKAAWHAHTLHQNALRPASSLQELGDVGAKQRNKFIGDLTALAGHGLVRSDRVGELNIPNGYKAIADDLFSLVDIFRSSWSDIQGKTAVTQDDLDTAEYTASAIVDALGLRDGAPQTAAASLVRRQRAFTLMMQAYDDARRIIIFLRWEEGDADDIAPSLYAGRGGSRRKQDEPAPTSSSAPAPVPASAATTTPTAAVPAAAHGAPVTDPYTH